MKSKILLAICLGLFLYGHNPLDLDQKTRDEINQHIETVKQKRNDEAVKNGKKHFLIDLEKNRININARNCRYCQISEKLNKFNFKKKWPDQPNAHCFGSTLYLINYLLTHPKSIDHSCLEILSEIQNQPNYEELVHSFSMNQHPFYKYENQNEPIELNPDLMKSYFSALIEITPSEYYVLPLSEKTGYFEKANIYTFLKELPNKLIMVGYVDKDGFNHCIAISTIEKKIFVFDPNLGLYHFHDLETLSFTSGIVLDKCRFRWAAAFDPHN